MALVGVETAMGMANHELLIMSEIFCLIPLLTPWPFRVCAVCERTF